MIRKTALASVACALAAASLYPAAATATGAAATATGSPRARAKLVACHPALAASSRYAVFAGEMRSLHQGADTLEMRFDLYRRSPRSIWFRHVSAPGLGVWNQADPGVRVFRFRQRVENLSVPAYYRASVSFRWLDGSGHQLARTSRVTNVCHQPDLRPDLRIGSILRSPVSGDPASSYYRVVVRNDGATAARDFDVALSVNGPAVTDMRTVSLLGAGESKELTFIGPRCTPGSTASAAVDPDNRVSEARERNNTRTVSCLATAAGRRRS